MSDYQRLYVPGGCYFFTVVTHRRRPILTEPVLPHLKLAFRSAAMRMPFKMPAIVVLPDHLHCIWSLPPGDADFPRRWHFIKASFSRRLQRHDRPVNRPVWQARYWEHLLRDETDFQKHLDYIHYNPVKHGYTTRPLDWRWSSFSRFVECGVYPPEWGESEPLRIRGLDME
jgi:putative transposase